MTRETRYPKISIIFIIGIILMLSSCDLDQDVRMEKLLNKLLIEAKETNTLLKNIERLLELDKGTKNSLQEELSDDNSNAYNNWSEELEVRK